MERWGLELKAEPPIPPALYGGQIKSFCGESSEQNTISPVNTVPQGSQMKSFWWKGRGLELSAKPSIPPVNTAPQGGQIKGLPGERWGLELELRAEPSIPPALYGGQIKSLCRSGA